MGLHSYASQCYCFNLQSVCASKAFVVGIEINRRLRYLKKRWFLLTNWVENYKVRQRVTL